MAEVRLTVFDAAEPPIPPNKAAAIFSFSVGARGAADATTAVVAGDEVGETDDTGFAASKTVAVGLEYTLVTADTGIDGAGAATGSTFFPQGPPLTPFASCN